MLDIETALRDAGADLPLPSDEATERALRRVLERPESPRRKSRRASRLSVRVVLVAAAILVLGGGIAIGFGGRIAELISGDSVPIKIHRGFERALVPVRQGGKGTPLAGRPIRSSERLVIEQPSRWGGTLSVYEARSTLGSTCYLLARTVALGATCELRAVAKPGKPIELISTFEGYPTSKSIHSELAGRPYSRRAVAVRVRFQGGGDEKIALTRGWFFYEPTRVHGMDGSAQVVAIDVIDANGATIATQSVQLNHVSIVPPQPVLPESGTVRLLQRSKLPNGGGLVAIWSGRDAKGDWCFRYLRNGRSQRHPAWNCGPDVGRYAYDLNDPASVGKTLAQIPRLAISWSTYGRGGTGFKPYVYAVGWAAPGITRLDLTYEDGTHARIPLHDRFYLFVVPSAHWAAGTRPKTLTGHATTGSVAGSANLYPEQLDCRYPDNSGCNFGTG